MCAIYSKKKLKDVVTMAKSAGSFNTLCKALEAANLVNTLQQEGPWTVFAPTDKAFQQLPEGVLDNLLRSENQQQLRKILTYHVLSGKVPSPDARKMTSAQTVCGQSFTIRFQEGRLMINNACVTNSDLQCSNGIIHVIDKIIMPR